MAKAKKPEFDEQEIAYLMEDGHSRRSAKSLLAKRAREEQAAIREAKKTVELVLGHGVDPTEIEAMLESVSEGTGLSDHGAAEIIKELFEVLGPEAAQGSRDHAEHFRANVGAADRALKRAQKGLEEHNVTLVLQELLDAAFKLGRAQVHRDHARGELDQKTNERFEFLLSDSPTWAPEFNNWLKNR